MLSGLRPILRLGARVASVRRKVLFECATADARVETAAVPVTFRYGNAWELRRLSAPEYSYDDAARAFGMERLAAGDRLVVGESGGRIVFYAWIMFGQMDMGLRDYARLAPDQAYTYKLFTLGECRGQRICPAYYVWLKKELREQGYRSVRAWVEAGNRASIRAHERAGFRKAGTIWHARFLFRSYPLLHAATA